MKTLKKEQKGLGIKPDTLSKPKKISNEELPLKENEEYFPEVYISPERMAKMMEENRITADDLF